MIHLRPRMLNRQASSRKSKPDEILETLDLREGQNIADIGAGGGYFSFRFADAVGKDGKVYAVDTNPGFLAYIREVAEEKELKNIVTVLATEERSRLPEKSIDLVFMRNVYHHLSNRVECFRKLSIMLRPNGKVAIVEYDPGGRFNFRRILGCNVPKEAIVREMKQAGYRLEGSYDFLPIQSSTVFSLKD